MDDEANKQGSTASGEKEEPLLEDENSVLLTEEIAKAFQNVLISLQAMQSDISFNIHQASRAAIANLNQFNEVSQLQSDADAGQREMIIHSLVPPFLQLAATDAVIATAVPSQSEKKKESSEDK